MRIFCTILLAAALASACEDGSVAKTELADTWKSAGLTVSEAEPFKAAGLEGECGKRVIDGVVAILCELPSEEAAKNARAAGLEVVGDATGAALVSGKHLLVVVDRDGKDPAGRTINALTKSFLGPAKSSPAAAAKPGDGAAEQGGESEVGGGLDSLIKKVSE